jgi:hypothetical protein
MFAALPYFKNERAPLAVALSKILIYFYLAWAKIFDSISK